MIVESRASVQNQAAVEGVLLRHVQAERVPLDWDDNALSSENKSHFRAILSGFVINTFFSFVFNHVF